MTDRVGYTLTRRTLPKAVRIVRRTEETEFFLRIADPGPRLLVLPLKDFGGQISGNRISFRIFAIFRLGAVQELRPLLCDRLLFLHPKGDNVRRLYFLRP